ncbi:hypothetical protein D3C81_686980 [compost metagenome]
MVARVLAEEFQRHGEHRGNLGVVGLVLDKIGDQPDERRHFQPMQGNQRAQWADDFHQARRQADFFFGFT